MDVTYPLNGEGACRLSMGAGRGSGCVSTVGVLPTSSVGALCPPGRKAGRRPILSESEATVDTVAVLELKQRSECRGTGISF